MDNIIQKNYSKLPLLYRGKYSREEWRRIIEDQTYVSTLANSITEVTGVSFLKVVFKEDTIEQDIKNCSTYIVDPINTLVRVCKLLSIFYENYDSDCVKYHPYFDRFVIRDNIFYLISTGVWYDKYQPYGIKQITNMIFRYRREEYKEVIDIIESNSNQTDSYVFDSKKLSLIYKNLYTEIEKMTKN